MKQIYLTSKGTPVKISHFPGLTRYKHKYLMNCFASTKINALPENLQLITCVDDKSVENEKSPLIKQLTKNNIPFINAAEGKDVYPWIHNRKIKLIYDVLQTVKSKYCLILDGIDVTINDNLDDIINIFKTYNKKVIFNATPWAHPRVMLELVKNRQELYGKYCFLNAGCCIGETKELKKLYKEALDIFNETPETDKFWPSEQYFVRKASMNHTDTVWFDHECKIFQVWYETELSIPEMNFENGTITYTIIDKLPTEKELELVDNTNEQPFDK